MRGGKFCVFKFNKFFYRIKSNSGQDLAYFSEENERKKKKKRRRNEVAGAPAVMVGAYYIYVSLIFLKKADDFAFSSQN